MGMGKKLNITIILFSTLFLPGVVHAENMASVTVDPVTTSLMIAPGETKTGVYKVTNDSDQKVHVTVEPRYWFMLEENEDIPIKSWLMIEPTEFDMEPKAQTDVSYTIKLPEGIAGELAAMIAFKPKPEKEQAVNVVFSVSLYVTLLGTEKIECGVSAFKIWKFEDRDALGIQLTFNNTGNVHVKPRITVYVQNVLGEPLQRAQFQYGEPTYPGQTHNYNGAIYSFKLKPGVYKAVIDAEFVNISQKYEKTVFFLVGPGGKVIGSSMKSPDDIKAEPESGVGAAPPKETPRVEAPKASGAEQGRTITIPRKQR